MAYSLRAQYGAPARPQHAPPQNEPQYQQGEQRYQRPQVYDYPPNNGRNQYSSNPSRQYQGQYRQGNGPVQDDIRQPRPGGDTGGAPGGYYEPRYQDQAWYPDEGVSMQAQEGDRPDQYGYAPQEGIVYPQRPQYAREQMTAHRVPSQSQYTPNSGYTQPGRSRPAPQRSYSDSGDRQAHTMENPITNYAQSRVHGVPLPFSDSAATIASSTTERSSRPVKEKILVSPIFPETLAWDNPFPTFPTNKKKTDGSRPNTASSNRISQESSRSQTKPGNGTRMSGDGHQQSRVRRPTNSESDMQRTPPQALPSVSGDRQDQPMQQGMTLIQQNQRVKQVQQTQNSTRTPATERRSDESYLQPSASQLIGFTPPTQINNVLPGGAPAMPHSILPVRGKENAAWSRNMHGQQYGQADNNDSMNGSRSQSYDADQRYHYHVAPAIESVQPLANVQEDSYGDLFDGYYEPEDSSSRPQNATMNRALRSLDEQDMPNFDALPQDVNNPAPGISFDQDLHLQPHQSSNVPPNGNRDGHGRSYDWPTCSTQAVYVNRSMSQPNIREQQPYSRQNTGFVPRPTEGPPPMPSMNSHTALSGHDAHNPNSHYAGMASPQPAQRQQYQMNQQYNGYHGRPQLHSSQQVLQYGNPNGPALSIQTQQRTDSGYAPNPTVGLSPRSPTGAMSPQQMNGSRIDAGHAQRPGMGPNANGRNGPFLPPHPDASNMGSGQGRGQGVAPIPTGRVGPSPPFPNGSRMNPTQGEVPAIGARPPTRNGPTLPPSSRTSNPDALPEHPAPVRPGLMQANGSGQAPKPPPVRQYNNNLSPIPQPSFSQPPAPRASSVTAEAQPVTHEELQRLRQTVDAHPNDQKIQLLLAKKYVEAASLLADEGGRADAKTKNRNREKYINDAHRLVKKLASSGDPEAMFYLADSYGRGLLGLAVDAKEAFKLYQSAAKIGHAQSAYRVAVCCEMGPEDGGGTSRDPTKAIQWYKHAAKLGDTPAMYKMGIVQLKGLLGQPKNPKEAIIWLKRAAERADEENPHALHELARLYESANGNDNIVRDEAYSFQLFTQAANLGYKFSQFRLGEVYEYGQLGCPVDPRQSIAWYSKAAVQEEHQSELALSGWYLTGSEGVLQQSDTEAYLWARKAAQAGLAKAEYAMGYFTEVGIGAPANMEDAKRWYWKASAQNFPKARERLEDLRKGGARKQHSRVSRSAMKKQSDGDCSVM